MTGTQFPSLGGSLQAAGTLQAAAPDPAPATGQAGIQEDLAARARDLRHTLLDPALLHKLVAAIASRKQGDVGEHLAVLLRDPADMAAKESSGVLPARGPMSVEMQALGPELADLLLPRVPRRVLRARPQQLAQMRRLWDEQICAYVPAHMIDALSHDRQPPLAPPPSLLEFAVDYLRQHPEQTAEGFLSPFNQLVQRDIAIPDNIATALKQGGLSFEAFRGLVDACAREIPPKVPAGFFSLYAFFSPDYVPVGRQYAGDWQRGFAAICSPLATALLAGGALSLDALLDWTGMPAHAQRHADGPVAPAGEPDSDPDGDPADDPAEPFLPARHITSLLANWKLDGDAKTTRNAALLRDPEVLRTLADSLVPCKHVEYLLSVADSVGWPVLAAEIDRVVKQYQAYYKPYGFYLEPKYWKSMTFYDMPMEDYGLASEETTQYLHESWRNIVPYQLLNQAGARGRLDAWVVPGFSSEDAQAGPSLQFRPARALFDQWSVQGIPMDWQVWMSQFLEQGFDEAWARGAVESHAANPVRLSAWFSHSHQADLKIRLDGAMKAVVLYWLNDIEIPPALLALAPAMIQSDMSGDNIDWMLRATAYASRLEAVFGPGADTPRQARYGFTTPDQLVNRIVYGDESVSALRDAAEQALPPLSPVRREIADMREDLRRALHALRSAHAEIPADTPIAQQCACLILAWEDTLQVLGGLLQPGLDEDAAQRPEDILTALTALRTNFPLHAAALEAPAGPSAVTSRV